MNMKPLILIPMLIIGIGLLPKAQALSPAPDGGYPGRNTAEGQNALFSLTTGTYAARNCTGKFPINRCSRSTRQPFDWRCE